MATTTTKKTTKLEWETRRWEARNGWYTIIQQGRMFRVKMGGPCASWQWFKTLAEAQAWCQDQESKHE